jgi:hypothetical protein
MLRGPNLNQEKKYKSLTGSSRFSSVFLFCIAHLQLPVKMQFFQAVGPTPAPALAVALYLASSVFASPIANSSTQERHAILDNDW